MIDNIERHSATLGGISPAPRDKAGGANPPGATLTVFGSGGIAGPIHPLTFELEIINAYELGSKDTLLDGALILTSQNGWQAVG